MNLKGIVAVALTAACASSTTRPQLSLTTPAVLPGIETFLADVPDRLRGKRVGLITNHTGIDRFKTSDIDLIARHKDLELVALLAPEHGIRGTLEAGDTVKDEIDTKTGVPVYSLYLSEDRGPTDEMLKNVSWRAHLDIRLDHGVVDGGRAQKGHSRTRYG